MIQNLPERYYPCFLGNGLDAVLIGPDGAMADRPINGPDRCYWYKSDCYYCDERPALPVPHRWYRKEVAKIPRAVGSWYELAPLGRAWYEVWVGNRRVEPIAGRQVFDPETATLTTTLDFGDVTGEITTFLHASLPLLATHYRFSREVTCRVLAGAGPWAPSAEEPEPFTSLRIEPGTVATVHYRIGPRVGQQALWLGQPSDRTGAEGPTLWISRQGQEITSFFSVVDDRDPVDLSAVLAAAESPGFDGLQASHQETWRERAAQSSLTLPDPEVQRFYNFGLYYFKAIQNPTSGGIPVGNLRQTWSSHVFWDSFFVARALIETNHVADVRAHCGFFERTVDHAQNHARSDFNAPGLKWDWELTHTGIPAYGEDWIHVKEQVHNNAAYSNILWDYYRFTRDRQAWGELYPLLKGIADFFLAAIVVEANGSFELRPLVGVRESAVKVPYDTLTVAGTIKLLRNTAAAARERQVDQPFAAECERVARGLVPLVAQLYNGEYFPTHAETDELSLGSLAPAYPMEVLAPDDPRIVATARAYRDRPSDLFTRSGVVHSPWVAGVLASAFAGFGDGASAWDLILRSRPAMNLHGGCAEFVGDDGRWNIQYFATAHGALCSAIHHLMLQSRNGELTICPALPPGWEGCHFRHLRADGLLVDCDLERADRTAQVRLTNATDAPIRRTIRFRTARQAVELRSGEATVISVGERG
jgi:hypothetical protein